MKTERKSVSESQEEEEEVGVNVESSNTHTDTQTYSRGDVRQPLHESLLEPSRALSFNTAVSLCGI